MRQLNFEIMVFSFIIAILCMLFQSVWFIPFLALSVYLKWSSRLIVSDTHFQQGGLVVDFAAGTIRIGGDTKSVRTIKGFITGAAGGGSTSSQVSIEWDDLKKPYRKFYFITREGARDFTARLEQAIAKAGGPTYS